jgi:integrase
MQLDLNTYISHIRAYKPITKATLDSYDYAMSATDIRTIDTDRLSELWGKLSELLGDNENPKPYARVALLFKLIKANLKLHGIEIKKDLAFNGFNAKLNLKLKEHVIAYTPGQIREILRAAKINSHNLTKLLLMLTYSGIRVSSALNVKFSDLKLTEAGVYSYRIRSKGIVYSAFLPAYIVELLRAYNTNDQDLIVNFDQSRYTTPFAKYYRTLLTRILIKEGVERPNANISVFHSLRHAYSKALTSSGVRDDNLALLMGALTAKKHGLENLR